MFLKIIIISIAVIIVGGAAYFLFQPFELFQNNKKNAELTDSVFAFMQYMSEIFHWINFSEIQATEMQWNGTAEKLILVGWGFKAEGVKDKDYRDLKNFFSFLHEDFHKNFSGSLNYERFNLDPLNTGSGSLTEYFGYRKSNDMVCMVAGQIKNHEDVRHGYEESIWDAVVKCAKPPAP